MAIVELPVYESYNCVHKLVKTNIMNIKIKKGLPHKHIISICGVDYKIQFYAPTWLYKGKEWIDEWNKHCGKIRGKRYVHLHKKKSLIEQIRYIQLIIKLRGCYLIKINYKTKD